MKLNTQFSPTSTNYMNKAEESLQQKITEGDAAAQMGLFGMF
jgi:hypothetical protein